MGRIGDKGPYSLGNVKCITNAQNGYDRRLNGVAARGEQVSLLTEKQVKEIYFATDTLKILAQRYLSHWNGREPKHKKGQILEACN